MKPLRPKPVQCTRLNHQGRKGIDTDKFLPDTSWDDIYNLYKFDRKLRLLVFDAIERIEVSLRTQIIYQLAHKYGSHWQDNEDIFDLSSDF